MFEGMFDTAEEILTGVNQGAVLSSWDRRPKNCADILQMPDKQRKKGYPIGLKNQGATCYLNSFLQILYHTPQLRKMILDLPLCSQTIESKTNFVPTAQHNFLYGFQRLFCEMSMKDVNSVSTDYLTKAFGWEGKEHVQQQDMAEAMKITFQTMQRALYNTQFQKVMKNLFKGTNVRYKTCRNCTISEDRNQDFYDFLVIVKNFKSLDESLLACLSPQSMQGDNKIFCEVCQQKQDMWLGTRFKTFPNILVFTLNRFDFDYQTFQRVKLNSYFQFNLQAQLSHLIDNGQNQQFQLYGVIVHRGSAHGGHYFCYIRDILHQSNWQSSMEDAHKQQQKKQLQKTPTSELSEQQKKKRQELENQDKIHQLKQPENQKLLQNWYELNDSIVTAIDAKKITSKYQGSECAYILFYRKKNSYASALDIVLPQYFVKQISKQNQKTKQQRDIYQFQKQHIIMNINQSPVKLNIKTPISQLLKDYCPQGFSLVLQAVHNNLPYYIMEFNEFKQYKDEDTIEKYEIYHQSIWKTFLVMDEDYQQIKDHIGKDKLPFEVNVLIDTTTKKIVLHQDQTLADLRVRLSHQFQIPYENQIIQLVTPYKQLFVTDELSNDQALLTKLGFIHECQIVVKNLGPEQKQEFQENEAKTQKIDKDLYCFIVERDDLIGIKKIYFSKYQTLESLLTFIVKSYNLQQNQKRRLRNLNGNRLYYIDHYSKQLQSLDLTEQMIKLRIQRGQIPIKGDICVKAKLQSKFQQHPQNTIIEKVFDPNTTINQLKIQICQQAKLNPEAHRIYLTDWMGQPVRSITRQNLTIFQGNFSRQQTICIRDIQSPIGSQLLHYEVYITQTGSPDNVSKQSFHSKTQIHKTMLQFKQSLLSQQLLKNKNIKPKQLRIRELKRDFMFGNVWRNHQKLMKDVQVNNNKLVIQILQAQEDLNDDQIVIILKKRNIQSKTYQGTTQLIFNAGKQPNCAHFNQAIKQKLQLNQQYPLLIAKYFNYNFQWLQINQKQLEKSATKKKDGGKLKGTNQPNKGKEQSKKGNDQPKKGKINKQQQQKQNKKEQTVKQVNHPNEQVQKTEKIQNDLIKQQQKQQYIQQKTNQTQVNESKPSNSQLVKVQKKKKQKKVQQTTLVTKTQYLNLRKPPTLLKDGDWIGWGNSQDIKRAKDNLQTDQDLSLRFIKKSNKNPNGYKRNEVGGFKINVGF